MKAIIARILICLYLATFVFPVSLLADERATNWNGYGDATALGSLTGTELSFSDSTYDLTGWDKVSLILQVDDTTEDGYSSDSVSLEWGYQTFTLCLDSGETADTCFRPRVSIDTCDSDTFGVMQILALDANGIATTPFWQVDTIGCAGYATQSKTFAPEWDVYMRYWVQGLAGNLTAEPLKLRITTIRRVYRPVRSK